MGFRLSLALTLFLWSIVRTDDVGLSFEVTDTFVIGNNTIATFVSSYEKVVLNDTTLVISNQTDHILAIRVISDGQLKATGVHAVKSDGTVFAAIIYSNSSFSIVSLYAYYEGSSKPKWRFRGNFELQASASVTHPLLVSIRMVNYQVHVFAVYADLENNSLVSIDLRKRGTRYNGTLPRNCTCSAVQQGCLVAIDNRKGQVLINCDNNDRYYCDLPHGLVQLPSLIEPYTIEQVATGNEDLNVMTALREDTREYAVIVSNITGAWRDVTSSLDHSTTPSSRSNPAVITVNMTDFALFKGLGQHLLYFPLQPLYIQPVIRSWSLESYFENDSCNVTFVSYYEESKLLVETSCNNGTRYFVLINVTVELVMNDEDNVTAQPNYNISTSITPTMTNSMIPTKISTTKPTQTTNTDVGDISNRENEDLKIKLVFSIIIAMAFAAFVIIAIIIVVYVRHTRTDHHQQSYKTSSREHIEFIVAV